MRRATTLCAPVDAVANATGTGYRPGLASAGSTTDWCGKELAPGGHQEQGESRVTEFRAPDSEKTSGAEVAKRVATAPFGEEYQRLHVNAT